MTKTPVSSPISLLAVLVLPLAWPVSAGAADITGTISISSSFKRDDSKERDAYGARSTPMPGAKRDIPERPEVQNVIVFIKENVPGTWEPPATRPVMQQVDATFHPRVLPVLVGTTVDFQNQDGLFHNVFSLSKNARFDLGRFPRPDSKSFTFTTPGMVNVHCKIHSHMAGYILVLPHPFFATPTATGSYRITGVPPGSYHLVAWHDTLPALVRNITVSAEGDRLEADFRF